MSEQSSTPAFDKFDEYKFFIDDTARLSERRQGVTSTYISVNSAVVGLITFLAAQESLRGLKLLLTILPAVIAGCIVCYFWYALLMTYKRLLRFRFDQLEKIEAEIDDCHGMFRRESDELYRNAPPGKKIEFSKVEARLPFLFAGLYALVFLTIILNML